ncbi:choice-of-anchor L domain-containing protein [Aquimarina macrocephali]|uniref:choice-of-anchor L domain-containing protein n=1 Tax=Aquimarina macrocephali TaxID=666563 RepID=UPI003F66D878
MEISTLFNYKKQKRTLSGLLFFMLLFVGLSFSYGQATYTANPTAAAIAAELQSSGIIISNPVITSGTGTQMGIFSDGVSNGAFEVDSGVALTTSSVATAFDNRNVAAYTSEGFDGGFPYNDEDLVNINTSANRDVVVFEFDFVAQPNYLGVLVEYQFGSEEYPDYVGSVFNDVFGFFVSDPTGSDPTVPDGDVNNNNVYDFGETPALNLAVVPGTSNSVSINNVNAGFKGCAQDGFTPVDLTQSSLFIQNGHSNDDDANPNNSAACSSNDQTKPVHVEFNGITKKFSANIYLTVGVTYRMKIAIADVGDQSLDSGVFISSVGGLPLITSSDDSGSVITTSGGAAVANVLTNDIVGGVTNPSVADVELAQVSSTHAGVTLNTSTGAVNVTAGTPAGIYTLVYNVCKPAPTNCDTSTVTVTVLADIDGDNIADIIDLDNDNDGILDINERPCYAFSDNFGTGTGSPVTSHPNVPAANVQNVRVGTNADFAGQSWYQPNSGLDAIGDAEGKYLALDNPIGVAPVLVYQENITVQANEQYSYSLFAVAAKEESGQPASAYPDVRMQVKDGFGTVLQTINTGTLTLAWQRFEFLFTSTTTTVTVEIYNNNASASYNTLLLDEISISLISCDSDDDGTPDYLDLDSDNDGCYDAIEANENVIASQLDGNGRINIASQGGVDGDGVPELVNSGGIADIGGDQGQGITGNEIEATKIQIDTQPTSSTICLGSNAIFTAVGSSLSTTTYTGTPPATFPDYSGSTATTTGLEYQWQEQVGGVGLWNNISGANSASLTLTSPALSASTNKYRLILTSTKNLCVSVTSDEATLTIDPVNVGGSIAGSTNVCTGTNSTTLTLSGHTGSIVRWESSTNNFVTDTDIANTTTSLTATNLTATTKYRAVLQSGVCAAVTSSEATITVDPASVGGSIAGSTNVCTGTNSTTLTLSGHTGSIVRWESSTNNFVTDTDIANTTTSLTATNLTATTKYRAVLQSGVCAAVTSSEATITVDPASVGGSIAGSTNVCTGTNSTTLTLSGHTGSIVRWESSTNNFVTDTDIANTTTSLTATNLTATTKYRAVLQSGVCAAVTSSEATITVDPASVGGSIAGSTNVCTGTNSTTLTLSGHTGSIVRWESSTNNFVTDTDIANTTTSLTATNLTAATKYRAVLQSGVCAAVTSSEATITIDPASVGGSIAGSTNVCTGTNSTTLTLSGHTGSIVRWESSTNNFVTDTDIANTTTSLTATNLTATTKYRAVLQSGVCAAVTSSEATITVDPASVGGSIAGSTNVCTGTNSTTLTLSGHTGSIVRWESSTNNFVTDTDIANTTTSLTATNLTATTKYRAVLQSGVCAAVTSSEATITVDPASVGGSIAGSTNVCTGTNSTTLTLSGHTGSIVRWESSTNNFVTDTDIANTTTSLTATNLTAATKYRAVLQSGVCAAVTSSEATITIDPASVGGSIAGSTNVCTGTNSTTLTLSGHTGSIVRWESSTNNFVTDTDIANTTTSLTATNLTATTKYRAVLQSGVCAAVTSSEATITVDPASVGGSIAGSTNVCTGTNSTTLTLSGHTGSIVRWESSTNNFVTDTDIANTTTSLTATNLTATTKYRAVLQSGVCAAVTSSEATITIDPASVGGSIAGSTNVCTGTNSTTLTLSGHTGSIVRWESSTNNFVTDTDIANTTTSLTATNLTAATKYRAVLQSGVCAAVTSSEATITVDPASVGGSIAGSTNVCTGTNSTTLTLSGHTGSIVRWESSINNFVTDTDIANTTTSLTATNLTATTKYRAVLQSGVCAAVTSSEATITIDPASVGGSIAGSTNVCTGTNSTTLTLSGHTGSIVRWESSTNNFVTDTDIANTTTSLTATNLTAATKYRAVLQSGVCAAVTSSEATITIDPASVGGSIAGSTNVCTGTNSTTLTLSGHTGSIVRWESSTNNFVTDTDIANTTTSLTATNLTATTKYRAVLQSGVCAAVTSSEATITVGGLVNITINSITLDNILNAAEALGTVAVTGIVGGDFSTGDLVTLTVKGNSFTGTVGVGGNFSINVPGSDLAADGDTTVDASFTATGTCSAVDTQLYSIDTTAPTADTFTTNDITPTLTGTGEANETLTITVDENGDGTPEVTYTVTTNASGDWSIDTGVVVPTSGSLPVLTDNDTLDVVSTDAGGNSGSGVVTIDTTAPTADTFTTNDITPTLTGTGEANETLTISVDENGDGTPEVTYTVTTNASGDWSIDTGVVVPTSGSLPVLTDNDTLDVVATDAGGNSGSGVVTIDTTAPTADTFTTNDITPTLTGTGEANETLTISVDENGDGTPEVTYTVTTNASGDWSIDTGVVVPTSGSLPVLTDNDTLDVVATDAGGNSGSGVVTIDTTAPTADTFTTNDITPTLTGTGEANETLTITVDENGDGTPEVTYTVTTNASGDWSIDTGVVVPTSGSLPVLTDNDTLDVVATDAGGNSGSGVVTIDTTAPTADTFTTNDITPTLTGTGEANETLTISVDENGDGTPEVTYTVTTNASGDWSIDTGVVVPTSGSLPVLTDNDTLDVVATDAGGNSGSGVVTIDTTAPTADTFTTNDITPTLTGTGEANETLTITVDENGDGTPEVTYTVTTNASGDWSIDTGVVVPTSGSLPVLTDNDTLDVVATDAGGNSGSGVVTIDTTAPTADTFTTNDITPTLTGTGEANETLTITVDENGDGTPEVTYTVTTNASGDWSIDTGVVVPTSGSLPVLTDNDTLDVVATDAGGNSGSGVVTIDTTAPTADTFTTNDITPTLTGTGEANETLTITVDENGDGTPEVTYTVTTNASGDWSIDTGVVVPTSGSLPVLTDNDTLDVVATDAGGNSGSGVVTIDTTAPTADTFTTNDITPTLTGTGEANETLTISVDENGDGTPEVTYTVTTNASGDWSIDTGVVVPTSGSLPVLTDNDTLDVVATDAGGNSGSGVVTIDTTAPTADTFTTNDITPTLTGTGEANETLTITVDENGDGTPEVTYTVTTNASGDWSIDTGVVVPTSGSLPVLTDNDTLDVVATDAGGNSGSGVVTIDTTAPTADTFTTNDITPTLTGTGEANETLTITVDENGDGTPEVTYTVTTNASGDWSIDTGVVVPTSGSLPVLTDNDTLDVVATDAGGNSGSGVVTIDTTAPTADTFTTNDITPTLTGTGEANETLTITVDENGDGTPEVTYTVTTNASGDWSIDTGVVVPTSGSLPVLTDNDTLDVVATDAGGNSGSGVVDIKLSDTDGDGINDLDEENDGTDPLDPCDPNPGAVSSGDCDGDGVINEFEIGDDPDNPQDTDGDGIPDILDTDDDDDGILTEDENPDPDGNGNPDDAFDSNGNGTPDYLEPNGPTEEEDNITVFSGMSPNGDGINDVFIISGIERLENTLEIYNRWGVKVYESKNYGRDDNFFRGISLGRTTVQGNDQLPVGTYYYVLNYTLESGEQKNRAGYLYINR